MRILLGILIGLLAWMIVAFLLEGAFGFLFPNAYGAESATVFEAFDDGAEHSPGFIYLALTLFKCAVAAFAAGYVASAAAAENVLSTLGLGVFMTTVVLFVEVVLWRQQPVWFHLAVVLIPLPLVILGGNLRPSRLLP
jgi:hypothetical protein